MPPNLRLQFRPESAGTDGFARCDERDASLAELLGHVAERGGRIRVTHRVQVAARCQMHANPAGAPDGDDRVRDFQHEPRAVLDGAAVVVGAPIRAVLQELIQQIAVRAVDLDAVKARALGVLRAPLECRDDAGNLFSFQRSRRDERADRPQQVDMASRRDGAGRRRAIRHPGYEGSDTRPTCHSCKRMRPPASCTARVTSFQPSTCSRDQMPGVSG